MVLIVEFINDIYWKIESLGTNTDDYSPGSNQKIVITDTWIDNKTKYELLWDDKNKKVILFPEDLKIELYRQQKLKGCRERFLNNPNLISESTLSDIVKNIKSSRTKQEIDQVVEQIDNNINVILNRVGL